MLRLIRRYLGEVVVDLRRSDNPKAYWHQEYDYPSIQVGHLYLESPTSFGLDLMTTASSCMNWRHLVQATVLCASVGNRARVLRWKLRGAGAVFRLSVFFLRQLSVGPKKS